VLRVKGCAALLPRAKASGYRGSVAGKAGRVATGHLPKSKQGARVPWPLQRRGRAAPPRAAQMCQNPALWPLRCRCCPPVSCIYCGCDLALGEGRAPTPMGVAARPPQTPDMSCLHALPSLLAFLSLFFWLFDMPPASPSSTDSGAGGAGAGLGAAWTGAGAGAGRATGCAGGAAARAGAGAGPRAGGACCAGGRWPCTGAPRPGAGPRPPCGGPPPRPAAGAPRPPAGAPRPPAGTPLPMLVPATRCASCCTCWPCGCRAGCCCGPRPWGAPPCWGPP
jgi:hypothetical protein